MYDKIAKDIDHLYRLADSIPQDTYYSFKRFPVYYKGIWLSWKALSAIDDIVQIPKAKDRLTIVLDQIAAHNQWPAPQ